jgi:hypothetical protein
VSQDKKSANETQQDRKPGDAEAGAMEEAQKEAAKEREEEGGYQ